MDPDLHSDLDPDPFERNKDPKHAGAGSWAGELRRVLPTGWWPTPGTTTGAIMEHSRQGHLSGFTEYCTSPIIESSQSTFLREFF